MGFKRPDSKEIYACTKLSDDKFNGNHPNNIHKGFVVRGFLYQPPSVGLPVIVGSLRTSIVTEIVDQTTFKTKNSTYKLEK